MNKYKTLGLCALLLALCATLGLSSCSEQTKKEGEKLSFTLGTMPSVDALPFYVAKDLGIYDSLGLELTLTPFASPHERDVALQSGAIGASITDYTSAMMQQSAGLPMRLLMPTVGRFALLTAPEAGISTPADLVGKRIALSSNTVIDYATDRLLTAQGIALDAVERTEVQKIPLRLEMLRSHQVDAAILPQPFAERGVAAGLPRLASAEVESLQLTGVVVSQQVVDTQAAALRLLIEGYRLAVERITQGERSAWLPIAQKALGPEAEALDFSSLSFSTQPQAQDLEAARVWLVGKGLIPESYQASALPVVLDQQ